MKKKSTSTKTKPETTNPAQLGTPARVADAETLHGEAPSALTPKKPAEGWSLIDGEEMNRLHADTFPIPSDFVRRNIEVGLHVKIGLRSSTSGGERFWLEILWRQATPGTCSFIGKVLSRLVYSVDHGIRAGDLVGFRKNHIIDIAPNKPSLAWATHLKAQANVIFATQPAIAHYLAGPPSAVRLSVEQFLFCLAYEYLQALHADIPIVSEAELQVKEAAVRAELTTATQAQMPAPKWMLDNDEKIALLSSAGAVEPVVDKTAVMIKLRAAAQSLLEPLLRSGARAQRPFQSFIAALESLAAETEVKE